MDDFKTYMESYCRMVDAHIESIRELLSDHRVRDIGLEFFESKKSRPEQTLNVFKMVSDLYYRENFHSDVIKVFLDPNEKHKEGTAFLFTFIDFINNNFGDKVYISKEDYLAANVEREYGDTYNGYIDILIMSENSKHCIIIENKMYNAVDMKRQLPRYYDFMTGHGYAVDAVVYLPLDLYKQPDDSTWTEVDKQHLLPLLCIIPVYQKKGKNFVTGWIEPCMLKTKNLDCLSILRQYGELLKTLSNNNMDNVILSKFYQSLKSDNNLETAISIRNMIQDLPIYMADRLCEKFKNDEGDYKVWKWKPNFCGIIFKISGLEYKIDIYTSEEGYDIYIFNTERHLEWAKDMKSLESFTLVDNIYRKKDFSFYDEEKVIECVKPIIAEMRERLINKTMNNDVK